jgi:hypothetical protein
MTGSFGDGGEDGRDRLRGCGPRPGGTFPKTGLRFHRHHQYHGSYAPDQLERHETADPVRSSAVKARIQCVPQASGSRPIVMINIADRDTVLVVPM